MGDIDEVTIGVGIGSFTEGLPDPETVFRYVERADELGIDSLWMPDHVISEAPSLDPSVLMSVIAARTQDIKMGPSVVTVPARNPVALANTYANLDYLTGGRGRVIMAIGLGADPRLGELMGIPAEERAGRLREAVEIMRRLWTEDSVEFSGEYYQLDGVSVNPKPAQGALDIWIGGNSEAALKRIARYGDGWFPVAIPPAEFGAKLDRLMDYCEAAGRVVERDEAGMILPTHVTPDRDRARIARDRYLARRSDPPAIEAFEAYSAFGPSEECVATIERYVEQGCTKFVLSPVGQPSEMIDQIETYSRDVIPEFGAAS